MRAGVLRPRTVASALRTAVYGAVGALFAVSPGDAAEAVDAVVVGAVIADYATWMIRALVLLPGNLVNGAYQAVVNLAVAWFLFDVQQVGVDLSPASIAFSFLAFMTVALLKLLFYTMRFAQAELDGS